MKVKLYVAEVKYTGRYSKSFRLSAGDIFIELKEYSKNYKEYVQPLIAYYADSDALLTAALQVKEIVKQGEYIRGIFGGEEKKGKETYAGLVITDLEFDSTSNEYHIKLYRMDNFVRVPLTTFKQYGCEIYKLIYRGCVHPFNLSCIYDIILSRRDESKLKEFLNEVLILNEQRLPEDDKRKLEKLREEAIQPDNVKTLNQGKYYVIYRCQRTFSATVFIPDDRSYIAESHLAYVDCGEEENKAYFYASALNYLAYKAIKLQKSFVRDQFARPIHGLIGAELTWTSFMEKEPNALNRVVELSKVLHSLAPKRFGNKSYKQERSAFKDLESLEEFKELVLLFDKYIEKHVGKDQLEDALSWVTGSG